MEKFILNLAKKNNEINSLVTEPNDFDVSTSANWIQKQNH